MSPVSLRSRPGTSGRTFVSHGSTFVFRFLQTPVNEATMYTILTVRKIQGNIRSVRRNNICQEPLDKLINSKEAKNPTLWEEQITDEVLILLCARREDMCLLNKFFVYKIPAQCIPYFTFYNIIAFSIIALCNPSLHVFFFYNLLTFNIIEKSKFLWN